MWPEISNEGDAELAWQCTKPKTRAEHIDPASRDAQRRPRVLCLADRPILANQADLAFSAFEDTSPGSHRPGSDCPEGQGAENGRVFFTIFHT